MIQSESVEPIINAIQDNSSENIENETKESDIIIDTSKQTKKAKIDDTSLYCDNRKDNNNFIMDYIKTHRININIRQVNNI